MTLRRCECWLRSRCCAALLGKWLDLRPADKRARLASLITDLFPLQSPRTISIQGSRYLLQNYLVIIIPVIGSEDMSIGSGVYGGWSRTECLVYNRLSHTFRVKGGMVVGRLGSLIF